MAGKKTWNEKYNRWEIVSEVSRAEAVKLADGDVVKLNGIDWYGYVVTYKYEAHNHHRQGGHVFYRHMVVK